MIRPATAHDWPFIERLLAGSKLPLDGVRSADFLVVEERGALVGCAAIEPHGRAALLRSVAIDPSQRGRHLGEALVESVIENARERKLHALWLLTTTAAEWFPRFGFAQAARDEVPESLKESEEFRGACPASATVMRLDLR